MLTLLSVVHSKTESNHDGQSFVKVLRVLRVFRPLKVMNKLKKLEVGACIPIGIFQIMKIPKWFLLTSLYFLFRQCFAVCGIPSRTLLIFC